MPAVSALLVVAGCVGYEPAPIDLARVPREIAARQLTAPELAQFVADFLGAPPWGAPPEELDLGQLQAIALFHRPELALARAQLRQAEAAHEVAGQLPNPRLTVGPGLVANPGDATRWLASVGLSFPLDLSGQRSAAAEMAASEVAAARLAVAQADQAIRADVVQRAFDLELQRGLETLAREQAQLLGQLAALVRSREAAGAVGAGDAAAAQAAAARAGLAATAAERESAAALTALAAALGLPVDALAAHAIALPDAERPAIEDPGELQQLAADAASRRLDVAVALCSYARSEAGLRLQVARQWPDLEIGPGYEYDQGLHKFRFDLGFTLPLFHGNDSAIEAAKAARAAAAATVELAQVRAITEVTTAWQHYLAQRRALVAARELTAKMAQAVDLTQRRAAAGADDIGNTYVARFDELDAQALLVQGQHDARLAWLQLEMALQQPIGPGLLAWQHAVPETQP